MTPAQWGFLGLVVFSVGAYFVLLRYIERTHPELWARLDRPTFEMSNLSLTYARFVLFLKTGEFLAVPDWKLFTLCAATIVSGWLVIAVGIYWMINGL